MGPEEGKRLERIAWLWYIVRHWRYLCFDCWMAHIDQYRYVQLGDFWKCRAGDHWIPKSNRAAAAALRVERKEKP